MIGEIVKKGVRKRQFKYSSNKDSINHWTYVLIPAPKYRDKIVEGFNKAYKKRKYISYSNGSNSTKLYDRLKPYKFDPSELSTTTYSNCCVLVSVLCRYAGIKTPKKCSSYTIPTKWAKLFTVKPYKNGMTLPKGSVIVSTTKPHTAVII